jgi:prepilin-type N-terminal cleavage/methylation domain-containing protein
VFKQKRSERQKGFTLPEVLIAMALISVISLIVMGALEPWIAFKQKLDTERRMQDVKNGITAVYSAHGMAVEEQPGGQFREFRTSVPEAAPDGALRCAPQTAAFVANSTMFSESPQQLSTDGYASPWCFMITGPLREIRDGVPLWFRSVAVVSTGPDGVLDAATLMAADGSLTLGGDDVATSVNGREIQAVKLKETLRRLNRVAQFYETYFTARYLSYPDRDITRYYFADGAVASTGSNWASAATLLGSVGIGGSETFTPWESSNIIQVNNYDRAEGGITVRTPATSGTGVLPYTALLRARVPSPLGTPAQYAIQVAVGNY